MKRITKISLLLVGGIMASCLEDNVPALDPTGSQNIIEFLDPSVPASPSGAIYPVYSSSYTLSSEAQYTIKVSYSGPNENDQNIDLVLAVDPTALSVYNTQMELGLNGGEALHGTTYALMPTENYSIPNLNFTIPKGESEVNVPLTVYPDKFDFSKNYAVPLRIVSASHGTLSAHYSVAILSIGVRNQYDGVYDIIAGNMQRNSATGPDPALSGDYVDGLTVDLVTLASNRVAFEPLWKDGSGVGGIDGTNILIHEDNSITVSSTGNSSMKHIAGAENSYDPETKTFTINIEWGTPPSDRVITGLKLQYAHPRP